MTYKILPTKEFAKDFKKLDSSIQKRIRKKVNKIAEDPTRYKHLHYDLKGSSGVWIDSHRLIFSYNSTKKEVYLEKLVFTHRYRRK